MTLDEFLRALEALTEHQEDAEDDPGRGNYSCEECLRCNNCRFCVGCDSCEDCTYCEESLECSGCTQSKRCVGCRGVSYCDDSRDCKNSRYLTLCVGCTNSTHCLACVEIDGGEFYVLNEKRTRKEYFALLRQVQASMRDRMTAGWRPPTIGLASEILDPVVGNRDTELNSSPWLPTTAPKEAPLPERRWDEYAAPHAHQWEDSGERTLPHTSRARDQRGTVEPRSEPEPMRPAEPMRAEPPSPSSPWADEPAADSSPWSDAAKDEPAEAPRNSLRRAGRPKRSPESSSESSSKNGGRHHDGGTGTGTGTGSRTSYRRGSAPDRGAQESDSAPASRSTDTGSGLLHGRKPKRPS